MKYRLRSIITRMSHLEVWLLFLFSFFSVNVFLVSLTWGENKPNKMDIIDPNKPGPHLKQYLTDKYTTIKELSSTLQVTPHGPRGYLFIAGDIRLRNVTEEEGEHGKERSIANAFLKEEADLLGITDMKEIREFRIISEVKPTITIVRHHGKP